MKITRTARVVALVALALCSHTLYLGAQISAQPKLWVATGVAHPVYQLADAATLVVSFEVVNDGDSVVDPGIGSSRLFINGAEPSGWNFIINNGLRNSYFWALPPGERLSFGYELGPRYFSTPGVYTVSWQVGSFLSPPVTFRVLPSSRVTSARDRR
jgi:hypothetical protein